MRKLVRKHRFWSYEVWKCEEFVGNARFEGPTCLVSILWFSLAVALWIGEAAKALLSEGAKARCDVILRGRRGTSWHSDVSAKVPKVVLCGRRYTFASLSEDELHFSWQAQHFGEFHRHFAWQAQHFRRVASRVLRIALSGLRDVVRRCKFRGRRGILWHVMKIDGSLTRSLILRGKHSISWRSIVCGMSFFGAGAVFSTLYTSRFTLYTPHSALYTLHSNSTLYTLHSTHLHFALHTLHLHSTLHTPLSAHSTRDTTLHTPRFIFYTLHSTLYTLHFTVKTPHSTLYTLHSTLYTLHSTLYTLHSTL